MVSNLIVNAAQAAGTGGTVVVRTEIRRRVVTLEVEDNGPGVPKAKRSRIFEPFYTTKQRKKGMGLGLAICANYVKQHLGEISVGESRLGGALFRVTLPLDNNLRVEQGAPVPSSQPVVRGRRPKLLIVDDEPGILRAYERVLGGEFDLTLESNPEYALELLRTHDFDAVVSETAMAGLEGAAIYRGLRERQEQTSFVFCTGAALDPQTEGLLEKDGVALLSKPIDFLQLKTLLPKQG